MAKINDPVPPTAVIPPSAKIAEGVEIGPYAVVGPGCEIGPKCWVGPHAVLEYATLEEGVRVFSYASVGSSPQDLKFKGEDTRVFIGKNTVIRECVTVNRGTSASGRTKVGEGCFIMAYAHVAHDCVVGRNVIMANSATLAGHVEIGDGVVMGGLCAVHQFVRIGTGAMIGGGSMVAQDVAPYCMTQGDRAVLVGLNVTGLRRAGLSREMVSTIKDAYRVFFLSGLTLEEASRRMDGVSLPPQAKAFVDFLKASKRGICRPSPSAKGGETSAEADG
jgi:UDP-N-acetylglucosamine acyltransferase